MRDDQRGRGRRSRRARLPRRTRRRPERAITAGPAPQHPQRHPASHPGDALERPRNNPPDEEDPPEQTTTTTPTPHILKTTPEQPSWFRWWPVVVVPGGRCRGSGRPRARPGCACRWRSGGAPCCTSGPIRRWRARAALMPSRGPCSSRRGRLRMSSALYGQYQGPGQSEAERSPPWSPPRRPPRTGPGPARSGWPGAAPRSRSGGPGPVGSAPVRPDGHLQGAGGQVRARARAGPPADDPSGVDVRHEGHVHPATHGAHVGDARHPQLVRPESGEMPVHQVGRAPPPLGCGPGGAHRPGQRTTPCRPVPRMSRTGGAPPPRDRSRDARRSRADPARRASRGPRTPSSRHLWTRPIPLRRASSRRLLALGGDGCGGPRQALGAIPASAQAGASQTRRGPRDPPRHHR